MPYDTINELPKYVKEHSKSIQKTWLAMFNSVYHRELKKGKTPKEAEAAAFPIANSILSQ